MSLLKILERQKAGNDDLTPITEDDVPAKDSGKREIALYAATNLKSWETAEPDHFATDIGIDGTCFRRLDPDYYAWLRHKMDLAKKAASSKRLSAQAFDTLRTRFNVIHAWAMEHLGDEDLRSAVCSLDPKTYGPPRIDALDGRPAARSPAREQTPPTVPPYLFPKDGDWRFTQRVRASAVPKVDAIRDQALSLGWSETRLYQNRGRFRFPCGEDYGLVCFLDENKRIGEVTRQSIEIVGPPPNENRLRFYNPEVDQPWIKKKTSKT